jgi:hypothetical protein
LAKEYEDIGEFERSFECLTKASEQRRRQITYSVDAAIEELERLQVTFNELYFTRTAEGHVTDEPIFVVGMPRTGSTLAERFLSRHSQVSAAGELQNFDNMIHLRMAEEAVGSGTYQIADRHDHFLRIDMNKVGRSYIASTRPRTGQTPRFIDKNPNNFLNVGAIAAALPRAGIVCMERDPMDSCYALYKQAFVNAFEFSYDQTELARYFAAYQRLMAHWDDMLPGRVVHLRYEDLVAEPTGAIDKVLSTLDLPWEDACADHRSGTTGTMSPSAPQVREPVYSSSVGKWRHFERQLEPLRKALEANGVATG